MSSFPIKNRKLNLLAYIGVGVYLLFISIPIIWLVMSSFKPQVDIFSPVPIWLFKPTLANYIPLMSWDFFHCFFNSIIVTISSISIAVFVGSLAGFALSRYKIPKKSGFSLWLLSTRMVPPAAVILPYHFMISRLHLYDTLWALIAVYTTFNLALITWLTWIYFDDIPFDLDEAAFMDGCSRFQIFLRIILPMAKFNLLAVAVLCTIYTWNEFLFALVLTEVSSQTLPVMLMHFKASFRIQWNFMTSAAVFIIIPVLTFTWISQKYLIRGVTLGAIK